MTCAFVMLIQLSRPLCEGIDPLALGILDALPSRIGGAQ